MKSLLDIDPELARDWVLFVLAFVCTFAVVLGAIL